MTGGSIGGIQIGQFEDGRWWYAVELNAPGPDGTHWRSGRTPLDATNAKSAGEEAQQRVRGIAEQLGMTYAGWGI